MLSEFTNDQNILINDKFLNEFLELDNKTLLQTYKNYLDFLSSINKNDFEFIEIFNFNRQYESLKIKKYDLWELKIRCIKEVIYRRKL